MRWLPLLLLVACAGTPEDTADPNPDADGDGFRLEADCDDGDPAVFPEAPEACNGLDDDCDGAVDERSADNDFTFYADADADGYGDPAVPYVACLAPATFVQDASDCDDGDPARHPGAPEEDCADPVDYNCDGSVGRTDADQDGVAACEDCDDADASARPGAPEVCDTVDNDCDGQIDPPGSLDAPVFYADTDGDGFGDPLSTIRSCADPGEGWAADPSDCDDGTELVAPGADEVCNGADDDCDDAVDEGGALGGTTWYRDADGDGFGDPGVTESGCAPSATGWVANAEDCDDGSAAVHPGLRWFEDFDGDGQGNPESTTTGCTAPAGWLPHATDCDDGSAAVKVGADETCDGTDNDCDGRVDQADPGLVDPTTVYYQDLDGDAWGTTASARTACFAPGATWVTTTGDCDDADTTFHPQAEPVCDDQDHDCDDAVDFDGDGDDWSDAACGGSDWADDDEAVYPGSGAPEPEGADCLDLKAKGYATGLHTIDPDGPGGALPFDVICDMETDGGGWTLLGTNAWNGDWTTSTVRNTTTWGSPSTSASYKGRAWNEVPFRDLYFDHDGSQWAVYRHVGDWSESWYAHQAGIAVHNCASPSYGLHAGNLTGLCSTTLYVHTYDYDGSACSNNNNAYGPTWSAGFNNGCPLDDPISSSFVSSAKPWGQATPLRIWAR